MFLMLGARVAPAEISKTRGHESDLRQQSRERNRAVLTASHS